MKKGFKMEALSVAVLSIGLTAFVSAVYLYTKKDHTDVTAIGAEMNTAKLDIINMKALLSKLIEDNKSLALKASEQHIKSSDVENKVWAYQQKQDQINKFTDVKVNGMDKRIAAATRNYNINFHDTSELNTHEQLVNKTSAPQKLAKKFNGASSLLSRAGIKNKNISAKRVSQ